LALVSVKDKDFDGGTKRTCLQRDTYLMSSSSVFFNGFYMPHPGYLQLNPLDIATSGSRDHYSCAISRPSYPSSNEIVAFLACR